MKVVLGLFLKFSVLESHARKRLPWNGLPENADDSWVCTCIDETGKPLGGIAFDIKMPRSEAEHKGFGSCFLENPRTHSVRCEKFSARKTE